MHNKFQKGIASILSAALVLGSVVTGVVPAKAKTVDGNKATYTAQELKLSDVKHGDVSAADAEDGALTLTFSAQWDQITFEIPAEILEAGLESAELEFVGDAAGYCLKLADNGNDGELRGIVADYTENVNTIRKDGDLDPYDTPAATEEDRDKIYLLDIANKFEGPNSLTLKAVTFTTTPDTSGNEPTSTKVGDNYETAYTLDMLKMGFKHDTVTVDGNKFTFSEAHNQVFYDIPQKVIDAGLVGFYYTGTNSAQFCLKIQSKDDIWANPAISEKYSDACGADCAVMIEADQRATSNLIVFMSTAASLEITVDNVVFITENAIGGTTDPGTDTPEPGTEDPGTTEPGTEDPGTTEPGAEEPTVLQLDKVKITKATSTKTTVKLTWGEVENATHYVIYRSTSKNGTYKKVKTVKKTTYADKKLNSNTKYYYKVKAVNKDVDPIVSGPKSAAKGVKTKK